MIRTVFSQFLQSAAVVCRSTLHEHSLDRIRDLSAESPQTLEALPDGVDVGHAHEHHLTVGIILYRKHRGCLRERSAITCFLQLASALHYLDTRSRLLSPDWLLQPRTTGRPLLTASEGAWHSAPPLRSHWPCEDLMWKKEGNEQQWWWSRKNNPTGVLPESALAWRWTCEPFACAAFEAGSVTQALAMACTKCSSSAFRQPHQLTSGCPHRPITAPELWCLGQRLR